MQPSSHATHSPGALVIPRERFELPGGAILLVSPRPSAPVTAIRIHIQGGMLLDPEGGEGTASFVGSMLDQGTSERDDAGIAECIEPYGGSVGGNSQGLHGSMVGEEWKRLLAIMVEMAARPTFPDGAIDVQLERAKSHMAVQEEDPRVQGGRLFRRMVYGDHRLAQPEGGTLETLSRITASGLRSHHSANWGSARAIIAVCGNVQPAEVHEELLTLLRDWDTGTAHEDSEHQFPERAARAEAFEKGREQVHIYFGHLGVRRSVEDYPALVVMDHVLGSGPGFVNRLSKKLRDEQGLAYSVYGDIHQSAGLLPGMFTAYIGTSPEHIEQAVTGIQAEVREICTHPVTQDELAMAKDYVTGSMVLGYERANRRAASLISQERFGFAPDHLETLRTAYAKVELDDVLQAAKNHLDVETACLAASGSVTTETLRGLMGLA